jgi:hypothetical protein
MARETIGYVRLEWTCPNCSTRNPGPQKFCSGCGSPQPENVAFVAPERQELVTDAAELKKADAGADIQCTFCGGRNPAGTATCTQCGADLKEGKQRVSGQVVGAFKTGPVQQVACPACGAMNPDTYHNCGQFGAVLAGPKSAVPAVEAAGAAPAQKSWLIPGLVAAGIVMLLCIFFVIVPLFKTEGMSGVVQNASWERAIVLMQFGPVKKDGWKDEIPQGAELGSCEQRYHHTQDTPDSNAKKVCGTPFVVDKGTGFGQVQQDCQYEVSKDYCNYTVEDWSQVNVLKVQGSSSQPPAWPNAQLQSNQRLGDRSEKYRIIFSTDKGTKEFDTQDAQLFAQAQPGTQWTLTVNGFGSVEKIEPAQ